MALQSAAPLRILYCSDTYPPQVNGVSVVTALSVAGMQERGWESGVVAPRYPKPYPKTFATDARDLSAVRLHVRMPSMPFPPYADIRLVAPLYGRVAAAISDFRPHIVHCQTEFLVGRLAQIAASRRGVPLVSSYHTDFSRYTESYGIPWLRPIVTKYIARFHRRSYRVYTPSDHAKDDLAKIGVHNVEVWGRGVDIDQFSPTMWSGALREQLGVHREFMFLHVGRLAPEKNVEAVLDAFRLFRDRYPHFPARLVVAGDGPSAEALRRRAGAGITFMGNLERHIVLPLLYASADAFVYASETETLGLVVLEAMASGLPVIATPVGGVADHLRDGLNGLAFPAGNIDAMCEAMARIVRDDQLNSRLKLGARKWAEGKSWRAELDRLERSYLDVLEFARSATARDRSPSPYRGGRHHGAARSQIAGST